MRPDWHKCPNARTCLGCRSCRPDADANADADADADAVMIRVEGEPAGRGGGDRDSGQMGGRGVVRDGRVDVRLSSVLGLGQGRRRELGGLMGGIGEMGAVDG